MDLTHLFKASVKTVKISNKTARERENIPKSRTREEFISKANDVKYQITQLRDLLIENRAAYMRLGFHLRASVQMSDAGRDVIDEESDKIIKICNKYVQDLRIKCLEHPSGKAQSNLHKLAVLDILSAYLNRVFRIHSEQKLNRTQYEIDSFKFLRLESVLSSKHNLLVAEKSNNMEKSSEYISVPPEKSTSNSTIDEDQVRETEENFNRDEIQLYQSENKLLLQEVRGLTDEVEGIERNVVDIARLQEIFTEKVSTQRNEIERIGNVVVGSTENIKEANEQIKQAIQRNAGLRVWILFFLIVMSFTLLFLDWYNE